MLDFLRKLFSYDEWAMGRSFSSLENFEQKQSEGLFAHILLAEKIWLVRLNGEDSSHIPTFKEIPLAECAKMADELHQGYLDFLDSLTEEALDSKIPYKNTKGVEFQTSIKDILTHVGLHGVYHRGQIALLVRGSGGEAVNTDFITFTRL